MTTMLIDRMTTVIRRWSVMAHDEDEARALVETRGPGFRVKRLELVGPVDGAPDLTEWIATVETPEQIAGAAA